MTCLKGYLPAKFLLRFPTLEGKGGAINGDIASIRFVDGVLLNSLMAFPPGIGPVAIAS